MPFHYHLRGNFWCSLKTMTLPPWARHTYDIYTIDCTFERWQNLVLCVDFMGWKPRYSLHRFLLGTFIEESQIWKQSHISSGCSHEPAVDIHKQLVVAPRGVKDSFLLASVLSSWLGVWELRRPWSCCRLLDPRHGKMKRMLLDL